MIEYNQLLLDATKVDKNGRIFTKACWDGIIESEKNKNHLVPIVNRIDPTSDLTSIPVEDTIGFAKCSWIGDNINVHMTLKDEALKSNIFMPSFKVNPEDIEVTTEADTITKGSLNCFFITEEPALATK